MPKPKKGKAKAAEEPGQVTRKLEEVVEVREEEDVGGFGDLGGGTGDDRAWGSPAGRSGGGYDQWGESQQHVNTTSAPSGWGGAPAAKAGWPTPPPANQALPAAAARPQVPQLQTQLSGGGHKPAAGWKTTTSMATATMPSWGGARTAAPAAEAWAPPARGQHVGWANDVPGDEEGSEWEGDGEYGDQYDDDEEEEQAEGSGWGIAPAQTYGSAAQSSWMNWGEEARKLSGKVPTTSAPSRSPASAGNKTPVSTQQRSQILDSLLGHQPQQSTRYSAAPPTGQPRGWSTQNPAAARQQKMEEIKQQRIEDERVRLQQYQDQHRAHQQQQSNRPAAMQSNNSYGWGDAGNEEEEEDEEEEEEEDGWRQSAADDRRVHSVVKNIVVDAFHPTQQLGSSYDMPSKALSYARQGTDTSIHTRPVRNQMQDYADVKFVESHGAALGQAERAFYATARPAKNRFHWMFPPDKDERVASLLAWIQAVSYGLASFGLHKFLQSRERGALFVNADYRPTESPNEPAFDWLTFEELQPTMDQILQESVAYYDPAVHVIVFVFLPSETGNSMAIWRRKIVVPNNVRLAFQPQIKQTLAALRKKYVLHVDELPPASQPATPMSPLVEQRPTRRRLVKSDRFEEKDVAVTIKPKKKKRSWWKRLLFIR